MGKGKADPHVCIILSDTDEEEEEEEEASEYEEEEEEEMSSSSCSSDEDSEAISGDDNEEDDESGDLGSDSVYERVVGFMRKGCSLFGNLELWISFQHGRVVINRV